jgi:nicotinamide-nucleotide amidase
MDALLNLSTQLGQTLKKKSFTLALAESCTGGLASATITDVAGSSAWFDCGFVTYTNAAKQSMLNVSEKTLILYGAVSEETAKEMAIGALHHSLADVAGSITGIAGPTGGSIDKPVGTVCFAYAIKNRSIITMTKHFTGDRQLIRHQSVIQLLNGLMDLINHQN